MSLTPKTPIPEGAIRYNTDSNKMEVWIGDKWMIVATSSPNLDGGARGVFAGGRVNPGVAQDVIQFITTTTQGNATDFGDLTQSRHNFEGCGSRTRGVFMGGRTPTPSDTIDFVTISSTANATDFGNLNKGAVQHGGCCSNETRGLHFNGNNHPAGTEFNAIDFITIASTGNALDFGDTNQQGWGTTAFASPTRGLYTGSYPGGSLSTLIEFVTIATTGNAQTFGDLLAGVYSNAACSNATRALIGGGDNSVRNTIEMLTIATLGNAVDFGDLILPMFEGSATADSTRGIWAGGLVPTPANETKTDVIQYLSFATGGNAIDFGNLATGTQECASTTNAHGGL